LKGAYINIKRYQLHPTSVTTQYPIGITDAHIQQKIKKTKKKKTCYSVPVLAAKVQPPPIQLVNSRLFKSDASKKETVHKRRRRPIKDLDFHPEDNPHSQNNAFNKAIARHNQLRPDLGFSP
jgi:hypothetical protein